MVSTNGYIRLFHDFTILFPPVAHGRYAATRLEVKLAALCVNKPYQHAAVHYPTAANAGDPRIESPVVILGPADNPDRSPFGCAHDGACRQLGHEDVTQTAAVAGRQLADNLGTGLQDITAVGVEPLHIAVSSHPYPVGHPAQVIAYQVNDGGMLRGLLCIMQPSSNG